ncbi:MAG: HAD hydrolase family protein [Gemmatimonadetes bacterium]|nr:HAD hydrolase family protein [Gemmatimonadota bacterium]
MTARIIAPEAAAAIRLVSLDVDGVLTDGSLWVGVDERRHGSEIRRFHALDGMATRLLQQAGLLVAFVSGKRSRAVEARARELGIDHVSLGDRAGKISALGGILSERGLEWGAAAHLGDDLADLAVMKRVGLAGAVANAVPEIAATADWIGSVRGGDGAVREFAEALLRARGEWDDLVAGFHEGGRFAGTTLDEQEADGA